MSLLRKIAYEDIDPENGAALIERLIDGEILLITDVSPVRRLPAHIRRLVGAYGRVRDLSVVDAFFESPDLVDTDCLAEICKAFQHIRDCRLLSHMFTPLARGIGGPSEILVDTGHFRCMFPGGFDRLSKRADMAEFFMQGREREPETFLTKRALGGRPHRDIEGPHYTFQYNMWFPLQDIPSGAGLLLFPECYRQPTAYYQDVDRALPPDSWGYGPAIQQAMSRGDMLLFHSQHFHASPTEEPDLTRVTVEFRVTTNCRDDNGVVYRHLFWNVKNFAPPDTAASKPVEDREASYLDATMTRAFDLAAIASPQECFNALFTNPEAARLAGNIRAGPRFIRSLKALDKETCSEVAAYLLDAPYTDDLSLALVRIFLLTGRSELADRFAVSMLDRSESYMFLMELGLLLGRFGNSARATAAYEAAQRRAADSNIKIDPFDKKIPQNSEATDIIMPRAAADLCGVVLEQTRRGASKTSNANLFDYRIYLPSIDIIQVESEEGPLRLTMAMPMLLVLRRTDDPDGIVWCCELDEWMTEDRLPAEVTAEEDVSLELAKKYYLELPKLIYSLIRQNQQLVEENKTLKNALRVDE